MRFSSILYLLAVIFCSCSCVSDLSDGTYTLELYSHGDLHGRYFSSLPSISSVVKEARRDSGGERVVFIDLGDHNHGTDAAYYFNHIYGYSKGEEHLYSRLANELEYDAIVAGNHDFEPGPLIYDKIVQELHMPYLGANVLDSSSLKSYFKPYTILNKGGIKVAVVGFTTPYASLWLGTEKRKGLIFENIHKIADSLVNYVNRVEKPHFTILSLHSGLGNGSQDDYENVSSYLAHSLTGADIILSAHDHLPKISSINGVYILNSGPYGKILDKAVVTLTVKDGKIVGKEIIAEEIHTQDILPDSIFLQKFSPERQLVSDFAQSPIGCIEKEINPKLILQGPCTYSNLLHYVQMIECGADLSFVSPTKYMGVVETGEVTYNDILEMYPFENSLYKVRMTGEQIRRYLEIAYSIFDSNGNIIGKPYKFDCAGGIKYKVTLSRPVGERVEIISFTNGREFSLKDSYTVAMVSYRANGGGELILEATGLEPDQLEEIIIGKYPDVRTLLYRFFKSSLPLSSTDGIASWKLVK